MRDQCDQSEQFFMMARVIQFPEKAEIFNLGV